LLFSSRGVLRPVFFSLTVGLCAVAGAQGPRGERPRYVLQTLDTDHDGILSEEEIKAASIVLLTLDQNGDGELAPDELEPPRTDAGASPDQLVTQMMSFDKNKDGVLTADELPERMRTIFARADKNKDGKLTPGEIRQTATRTGSPNGRQGGPASASGMMRMDPILNALDTDHDGMISAAEIKTASASLLTLDVNHDGSITADEMKVRQQTPADRVAHMLDEFDTNKDGKLSSEEVPDGLRPRFAASDKNGDGFLDSAELLEMMAAMPQQRGPGGGGNRGPGAPSDAQPKGPQN
jgi:Ca2+-binding EF-hand superfamily protein